jgi:hypothetical protein
MGQFSVEKPVAPGSVLSGNQQHCDRRRPAASPGPSYPASKRTHTLRSLAERDDPLITGVDFDALIADKAFDNDALRATLNERGAIAVIPARSSRCGPLAARTPSAICEGP